MPTYTFRNNNTGEEQDYILRMSELDAFKQEHPHLSQVINSSAKIVTGVNQKPDSGFRDVLKSIKKANRGSNINTW